MTIDAFIKQIPQVKINKDLVNNIESVYNIKLPDELAKIVSFNIDGMFFEGNSFMRLLSNAEIKNATSDLHINFQVASIIPLFDTGDNNFIVFNYNSGEWSKFNINDEIIYKQEKSLLDILK